MRVPSERLPDSELARRVAKVWPHREHEANLVLSQFCRAGVHRWRRLDLTTLVPGRDILHCFRCSKIKIDGIVYEASWRRSGRRLERYGVDLIASVV